MGYYLENDKLMLDGEPAAAITKEAFLLCYEEWVKKPYRANIKSGRKPKIDWDKACALKRAGWKNKEIAAELGASYLTIANYIKPHLREYLRGKRFSRPR
jgi:hypothetical protein